MSRCVITGGAPVENYKAVRQYLRPDDFHIFCDCGLKHADMLKISPNLIVGDFDSWNPDHFSNIRTGKLNYELNFRNIHDEAENSSQLLKHNLESLDAGILPSETESVMKGNPEILVIPHEKFDTDTVYGVREGIERGFDEFLLIGVIGKKLYHSLANLYILVMLNSLGKKGLIVDDYSDMELISRDPGIITSDYSSFSLINITGKAEDIRIEGAKYDYLPGGKITCDYQYGTSNEVLPGMTAKVTVGEGMLLLIRDRK